MANRGTYIDNLPKEIKDGIRRQIRSNLTRQGYKPNEVTELADVAMTYRIGDIDDLITAQYWIDKANKEKPKTKRRR